MKRWQRILAACRRRRRPLFWRRRGWGLFGLSRWGRRRSAKISSIRMLCSIAKGAAARLCDARKVAGGCRSTANDVDPRFFGCCLPMRTSASTSITASIRSRCARAAYQFVGSGRIVSGGSTLTMQLARLLEPREHRTLRAPSCGRSCARLRSSARSSKDEILALYLTLAPYGGNLEGIRAASLAYFGKEPRRLTLAEAALLVALPQSPELRRPDRFAAAGARRARPRARPAGGSAAWCRRRNRPRQGTKPCRTGAADADACTACRRSGGRAPSRDKRMHRLTIDRAACRSALRSWLASGLARSDPIFRSRFLRSTMRAAR